MSDARTIRLAAIGDAEDPATWSGIPYHFLRAARAERMPIEGLRFDLGVARSPARRLRWALGRMLRGRRPRGMQYDDGFLRGLWETGEVAPVGSILLNCSQVFPQAVATTPGYRCAFFLDQTLRQLFDYYGHAASVASDLRHSAIARETAQYRASAAMILQSRWAAHDVLTTYGVDPAKVHVVLPGANLDPDALAAWDAAQPQPRTTRGGSLRIGFVGKDWRRKGLDRLIRAVTVARAHGADVVLQVVGVDPAMLPAALRAAAGVEWLGFVDKRHDPTRFLQIVGGFDIGCLLSREEAGGIALLEFARLAVPTLAPDTGGAPEYAVPGASTLIAPDASDNRIAEMIAGLAGDDDRLTAQRRAAWEARHHADWRRCAGEIRAILERIEPPTAAA